MIIKTKKETLFYQDHGFNISIIEDTSNEEYFLIKDYKIDIVINKQNPVFNKIKDGNIDILSNNFVAPYVYELTGNYNGRKIDSYILSYTITYHIKDDKKKIKAVTKEIKKIKNSLIELLSNSHYIPSFL
jgi:hypothetical protein